MIDSALPSIQPVILNMSSQDNEESDRQYHDDDSSSSEDDSDDDSDDSSYEDSNVKNDHDISTDRKDKSCLMPEQKQNDNLINDVSSSIEDDSGDNSDDESDEKNDHGMSIYCHIPEQEQDDNLIRRQKAPLFIRQKKWADTFTCQDQMALFVIRELLSNATDAILRQDRKSDEFTVKDGKVDITVKGTGKTTILLKVTDNGDGCEDFEKSIMTEGTSVNANKIGEGISTGGKGSAKDCFSVQDGFKFVSKTKNGRWRYFAGSQDVALEHVRDCKFLNLENQINRGAQAEKSIERIKKCACMSRKKSFVSKNKDSCLNNHGTTVELALAPIVTAKKKAITLPTRIRRMKLAVEKVIKNTVGTNGELSGLQFKLNEKVLSPLLAVDTKEHEIVNDNKRSKAPYTNFNKQFKCFKGEYQGLDNGDALIVVVSETGMYQFHKQFQTNHMKKLTLVIKCSNSCKQLDASRLHFRNANHQDVLEEIKSRMIHMSDMKSVTNPNTNKGDGDSKIVCKCNSDVSSIDPLAAFFDLDFDYSFDDGNFVTDGAKYLKRKEIDEIHKQKKVETAEFAKKQSNVLVQIPVACPQNMSPLDPRVILVTHTSRHVDYLIAMQEKDHVPSKPSIHGTNQTDHSKLYRMYCITINMINNVRKAAEELNAGELCSKDLRVQIEVNDNPHEMSIHKTHSHRHVDGKCVIGVNLLDLESGKARFRYDYPKGIPYKKYMSLLNTIIYSIAHCLMHKKACKCQKSHEFPCAHFYEIESKIRSYLTNVGVTDHRYSIPDYIKKANQYAKKLNLSHISLTQKKKELTSPTRFSDRLSSTQCSAHEEKSISSDTDRSIEVSNEENEQKKGLDTLRSKLHFDDTTKSNSCPTNPIIAQLKERDLLGSDFSHSSIDNNTGELDDIDDHSNVGNHNNDPFKENSIGTEGSNYEHHEKTLEDIMIERTDVNDQANLKICKNNLCQASHYDGDPIKDQNINNEENSSEKSAKENDVPDAKNTIATDLLVSVRKIQEQNKDKIFHTVDSENQSLTPRPSEENMKQIVDKMFSTSDENPSLINIGNCIEDKYKVKLFSEEKKIVRQRLTGLIRKEVKPKLFDFDKEKVKREESIKEKTDDTHSKNAETPTGTRKDSNQTKATNSSIWTQNTKQSKELSKNMRNSFGTVYKSPQRVMSSDLNSISKKRKFLDDDVSEEGKGWPSDSIETNGIIPLNFSRLNDDHTVLVEHTVFVRENSSITRDHYLIDAFKACTNKKIFTQEYGKELQVELALSRNKKVYYDVETARSAKIREVLTLDDLMFPLNFSVYYVMSLKTGDEMTF